jgi:hypothetical protein
MFDLLLAMSKAADHWRTQGVKAIPKAERDGWIAQYFAVVASGFGRHLAQAPPISSTMPKKWDVRNRMRPKICLMLFYTEQKMCCTS